MKPKITSESVKNFVDKIQKFIPKNTEKYLPEKVKNLVPAKFHKYVIPGAALLLILILCLACCSGGEKAVPETVIRTVAVDNLDVHKKPDADSKVLSQLPKNLEIEILEQKTADDIVWGRIDGMTLADGEKVKAGWVDLQHVRLPGEPKPEKVEPVIKPTEPPTEEPPVVYAPDPERGTTVMGTVMTGKLNIRKGAGSKYEAFDAYYKGDRIEILEILTVDDTKWGRTGKGWIGMGYVRLDGTAPDADDAAAKNLESDGNYKILGYGIVNLGELNVRKGPGTTHEKVATVEKGARYAYYQIQKDWVRIEKGWVSTEYFYVEGATNDDAMTGIATADDLKIRTGPSTAFKINDTLKKGDTVEVLAVVNGWGYTAKGWVNMSYVEETYSTGSGKVTQGLNIRKEPTADSEKVGEYKEGDRVTILEVSDDWGRTDKGWIHLKYVRFD